MTDLQDLPAAWQPVLAQLRATLGDDARLSPAGSWATGTADQMSDLDLTASGCTPDAPSQILRAFQPLHWNRVGDGRTVAMVLAGWQRLDVTFADPDATIPAPDYPPLVAEAREFIRVCGLLPVVACRQDWVVAMQGGMLLRDMLITRMKSDHGGPPGGALSLKKQVSRDDYATLQQLPPLYADRDAVLAFHHALIIAWGPRTRNALAASSQDWPRQFASATEQHLAQNLGVEWRFGQVDSTG